jgi:hypothetical protein
VLCEEVADDRFERVQLAGCGVHEPGAQVVAEPQVAVGCLGLAQALRVAAFAVFPSGGTQFVVVEAGAGEERLFSGGLFVLVVGECSRARSMMNRGFTTQMPSAKSGPRWWT